MLDQEEDNDVSAIDYLIERGVSETAAVAIVIHALVKFAIVPADLVREAAVDLGYQVTDLAYPPPKPYSDRN